MPEHMDIDMPGGHDKRLKLLQNGLFLVSHGETPTNETEYYKLMFHCPANVRIVLFEHTGSIFHKYDAGFIFNFGINRINYDGADIAELNETKLNIPIKGTKNYYCRVYNPGEYVPNIKFTFTDSETQVGIFDMLNRYNHIPNAWYVSSKDAKGVVSWNVQFDTRFINTDIVSNVLGRVVTKANSNGVDTPFYEKPNTNLGIITNAISTLRPEKHTTLYVISCRGFTSPYIESLTSDLEAANTLIDNTSKEYINLFSQINLLYNDYCKKTDCALPSLHSWNLQLGAQKKELENNLTLIINGLKTMVSNAHQGYRNLVDLLTHYSFNDYTSNRITRSLIGSVADIEKYLLPGPLNKDMLSAIMKDGHTFAKSGGGKKKDNINVLDYNYYKELIDSGEDIENVINELNTNYS